MSDKNNLQYPQDAVGVCYTLSCTCKEKDVSYKIAVIAKDTESINEITTVYIPFVKRMILRNSVCNEDDKYEFIVTTDPNYIHAVIQCNTITHTFNFVSDQYKHYLKFIDLKDQGPVYFHENFKFRISDMVQYSTHDIYSETSNQDTETNNNIKIFNAINNQYGKFEFIQTKPGIALVIKYIDGSSYEVKLKQDTEHFKKTNALGNLVGEIKT